MKKISLVHLAALAATLTVTVGYSQGVVSTDRFGYTGSVERYANLSDALAGTNLVSTTAIGNRDLSLYVVQDMPAYGSDMNIIMGSWWYTTEGQGISQRGYGNVRGNSGVGFMQLYDADSSTDTSASFGFGGFDGTYWTTFSLSLTGVNAGAADYARFWVDFQGNGADKVVYHNYSLALTATGLEGVQSSGVIESNNHPTGVTGSFTALFENVSTTYTQNNGFYKVALALDMVNWAYENEADLTVYEFSPSQFAAPAPASVPDTTSTGALLVLALGTIGFMRHSRHSRRGSRD